MFDTFLPAKNQPQLYFLLFNDDWYNFDIDFKMFLPLNQFLQMVGLWEMQIYYRWNNIDATKLISTAAQLNILQKAWEICVCHHVFQNWAEINQPNQQRESRVGLFSYLISLISSSNLLHFEMK